jgi:hypothetical protein
LNEFKKRPDLKGFCREWAEQAHRQGAGVRKRFFAKALPDPDLK